MRVCVRACVCVSYITYRVLIIFTLILTVNDKIKL